VQGPGDKAGNGHAQCAMTQMGNDVATRELHMIVVDRGHLYHSVASGFGPARDASGFTTTNRFSNISPWTDVGSMVGANFGTIENATIVASRQTAISILFEAEAGTRHRLWHAVRFSANGSWRPAEDVTAASGESANGFADSSTVAAGMCPSLDTPPGANDELVYITWNTAGTSLGRMLSTPRVWTPGAPSSSYSPLRRIPNILVAPNEPARQDVAQTVRLFGRPFP
jgi:hypothetical protein